MLQFSCPGCSRQYKIGNDLVGKALKCPSCEEVFIYQDNSTIRRCQSAPPPIRQHATTDNREEALPTCTFFAKTPYWQLCLAGTLGFVALLFGIAILFRFFGNERSDAIVNSPLSQQPEAQVSTDASEVVQSLPKRKPNVSSLSRRETKPTSKEVNRPAGEKSKNTGGKQGTG